MDTGLGVSRVHAGDHVVLHWRKAAGIDAAPPVYRWRGQPLNAGWVTTFNQYAVASENRLTPIPRDFDLEAASLFGCPVTTGLGVIENDAQLLPGETIIVLGAGGVGLSVIQSAALAEAAEIVVVDRSQEKLALAVRLGATHTVLASTDLEDTLRSVVGRQGADVVVENTGNRALIELAYLLAKPQGRAVLVGVPRLGEKASIDTLPLHFGKRLTGSHGGASEPDRDIPRLVDLSRSGRLRLQEMITERGTLADIGPALERLRDGRVAGRCVLEVSRE
jgi:S-(hydroxymethyl)glutathione dehydrogenase/alcohol dehydrogenase